MTPEISENMLFALPGKDPASIWRVLGCVGSSDDLAVIDIKDKKAYPVHWSRPQLEEDLKTGTYCLVIEDRSVMYLSDEALRQTKIKGKWKKWFQKRDRDYEVIQCLKELSGNNLLDSKARAKAITEYLAVHPGRRGTILDIVRRYFRGGQCRNALLPNWEACGGRGKRRFPKQDEGPLGYRGGKAPSDCYNVSEDEEKRIVAWVRSKWEGKRDMTLEESYLAYLDQYHCDYEEMVNGRIRIAWKEPHPTFDQYYYHYRKARSEMAALVKRSGEHAFNTKYRFLPGRAADLSYGPCSRYEIDNTPSSLNLVHSEDRTLIIGKPFAYGVVDVYSGIIAGIHVSLKTPCYEVGAEALLNAFSDKVEFCRRWGIDITEEEWPCHHICDELVADLGEFKWSQVDHVVEAFDIRVENTEGGRPDEKGSIEACIHRVENEARKLPGGIPKTREWGDRDPAENACITLEEFMQHLIRAVLLENRSRIMKGYRLSKYHIRDGVNAIPLELWNWGIRNRTGLPRTIRSDQVKYALLPADTARVTRRGFRYEGLEYHCGEGGRFEEWFIRAAHDGEWKTHITRQSSDASQIYVLDGAEYVPVELAPGQEFFLGKSFDEVRAEWKRRKLREREKRGQSQEDRAQRVRDRRQLAESAMAVKKIHESVSIHAKKEQRAVGPNRLSQIAVSEGRYPDQAPERDPQSEERPATRMVDLNKWKKLSGREDD